VSVVCCLVSAAKFKSLCLDNSEKVESTYRDIHGSQQIFKSNVKKIESSSMSDRQKGQIRQFVIDLRIGKAGKKVKIRRINSYLHWLSRLHKYFLKDFDQLTEDQTTKFYLDLHDDRISKDNGFPYADASKDEILKALRRFLGWAWSGREDSRFKRSVSWMKGFYKISEKKALTLEQVREIILHESSIRNRCLFLFQFDSGARIEEGLNVRIGDITRSKDNKYYMVHLRGTKNDLAERTIAIPLCSVELEAWLKAHPDRNNESAFLFNIQYDNSRKIIRQMSIAGVGFAIKPHELRHSSATYYVTQFGAANIAGFYYRFGWEFGSKQANIYIKSYLYASEVEQCKVVKSVEVTAVSTLKNELDQVTKANAELTTRLKGVEGELQELKSGKWMLKMLMTLVRQDTDAKRVIESLGVRGFDVVLNRDAGAV